MNNKGDFLLYLIFTIIILIIGAILYFVYLNEDGSKLGLGNTDSNFLGEFKSKLPPTKDLKDKDAFQNTYHILAKIKLDMKIELEDKNLIFDGNPTFLISDRKFVLKDPTLNEFSGTVEKTGFSGYVNEIQTKEDSMEIMSQLTCDFKNIEQIQIKNIYLDIENANIIGEINVQDKKYELNKTYLKLKGFSGDLKFVPDKEDIFVNLDGNIGYLELRDNQVITILK